MLSHNSCLAVCLNHTHTSSIDTHMHAYPDLHSSSSGHGLSSGTQNEVGQVHAYMHTYTHTHSQPRWANYKCAYIHTCINLHNASFVPTKHTSYIHTCRRICIKRLANTHFETPDEAYIVEACTHSVYTYVVSVGHACIFIHIHVRVFTYTPTHTYTIQTSSFQPPDSLGLVVAQPVPHGPVIGMFVF
jgi:hypothetical protein